MPRAREDFEKRMRETRRLDVKRHERDLRQMAQAAPAVDVLTKSAEWNYFMSLLQAKIDELTALLEGLTQALAASTDYDMASMAREKACVQAITAQRDTLQNVLALPKQIIEHGEKAGLALHDYSDA